ncbi:hypothetical protein FQP85_12005 [Pseudoalteromonas neustonica]|uniref:Transposase n=1 Tax=Pseudoalteromonas neustonica TaxID=1840331 RepID=A0ABY3FCV9_9GAMM|nr:hypothetical protein FQP85_12005 [Pseudoalteromonas neustonica]
MAVSCANALDANKLAEINRDKGAIRIYSIPKKRQLFGHYLFFIIKLLCYVLARQNTSFVQKLSEFTTITVLHASKLPSHSMKIAPFLVHG